MKKNISIHFLYFFIPIFICSIINVYKECDVWFLLNHGRYVINNGFPLIEPFTIHNGLSFIMQQWLASIIFYIAHSLLGIYGLKILLQLVNILMLYIFYKICMITSNNQKVSIVLSSVTQTLLLIFYVPRPWIFTFLNLAILLYILEYFFKNKKYKFLFLLPVISLLQINIHSSMWFMLFIFILPYLAELFIKHKYKDILIYLLLMIFMFIMGFINPYGIDNILYIFKSYGDLYINRLIIEMQPFTLMPNSECFVYSILLLILVIIILGLRIYFRKIKIRHLFLFIGLMLMSFMNIRSIPLFIIGTIPFLSDCIQIPDRKKFISVNISIYVMVAIIIFTTMFINIKDDINKKYIDLIIKRYDINKIVLYTDYDVGSYAEYRGVKVYIDSRAEVFIKRINKKKNILEEYYNLCYGKLDYDKFMNKYNFTHLIVKNNSWLNTKISNDDNYIVIYSNKDKTIYEKSIL